MTVTLIVICVLFVLWVLMNFKASRPDGTRVLGVHPYRTMMFHLMPSRNESVVYFDAYARAEKLLEYLEAARKHFPCDVTHCLVGAAGTALPGNTRMNQFTVGRRLYERKGRWVTFSMKRRGKDRKAKISAVKMEMKDGLSFRALCDQINGKIDAERSGEKSYTDKELSLFLRLPRAVLAKAVPFFRWLDYHNMLPGSFIKGDPMYTSMFIANLGSLDMAAGYHHLYEWGTCPLFMMVGKIEDRPVVEDGQVVIRKLLHIRWSYDERIDDGLTASFGIKAVNFILENPFEWLGCVAGDGSDERPMDVIGAELNPYDRFAI